MDIFEIFCGILLIGVAGFVGFILAIIPIASFVLYENYGDIVVAILAFYYVVFAVMNIFFNRVKGYRYTDIMSFEDSYCEFWVWFWGTSIIPIIYFISEAL